MIIDNIPIKASQLTLYNFFIFIAFKLSLFVLLSKRIVSLFGFKKKTATILDLPYLCIF